MKKTLKQALVKNVSEKKVIKKVYNKKLHKVVFRELLKLYKIEDQLKKTITELEVLANKLEHMKI